MLDSSPSPTVMFFSKIAEYSCHAWLSPSLSLLVVTPPCHFDRRAANRQTLIETGQSL